MNNNKLDKNRTVVYFVRHGSRALEKDNKVFGWERPGPGLSQLGRKQSKSVAKEFSPIKENIDLVISSSMTRAKETAKEICKVLGTPLKIYDELCEFDKIVWERKFYNKMFWDHYKKHKLSVNSFDKILDDHAGKTIIIVCHGNVIKGLLGRKLGLSFKKIGTLRQNNCHVSLLQFKGKKLEHLPYMNSPKLIIEY